jgi:hypothetical protein
VKTYSFYHRETGRLAKHHVTIDERQLAVNTPADHEPIEGVFDPLRQRVDVATRSVVEWAHPNLAALDEADRVRALHQRAAALEAGQARALRSLALNPDDAAARRVLEAIEREIAASGVRAAPT